MAREISGGVASALFSQVQLRVLALFLAEPSRSYQLTQVIDLVGSGRGAVQREIEKLTRVGILNQTLSGSRKVYQANRQCPIFQELHGLILKTVGLHEPLRKALKSLASKIAIAFVYGSIARGEDSARSDVDLMVIGDDIAYADIYKVLQRAEEKLARPVNPNVMAPAEWAQKLATRNAFISKVAQQPKLFIIGTDDELKGIGQSG